MKRVLLVGALGAIAIVARKLLGIGRRKPDFTDVDNKQPQRSVVAMEEAAEVPGGVRP
jgi:hypothetical protein